MGMEILSQRTSLALCYLAEGWGTWKITFEDGQESIIRISEKTGTVEFLDGWVFGDNKVEPVSFQYNEGEVGEILWCFSEKDCYGLLLNLDQVDELWDGKRDQLEGNLRNRGERGPNTRGQGYVMKRYETEEQKSQPQKLGTKLNSYLNRRWRKRLNKLRQKHGR